MKKYPVYYRFSSLASGYVFATPRPSGYEPIPLGMIESTSAKKVPRDLVLKAKTVMPHDPGGRNILMSFSSCRAYMKISNSTETGKVGTVKASTLDDEYQIALNLIKGVLK